MLRTLGVEVQIYSKPNEVPDPIPFEDDEVHRAYDAEYVNRFWRVLVQSDRVFKKFRSHFIGKCSPVHLFWGALDLAVTRFSGRPAPAHPGGIPNLPDRVTREAYSQEVSSCGFWSGSGLGYPAYYSYAYAELDRFAQARVRPIRPSTAPTSTNSSCPTTSCARRPILTRRCWTSCNPRTKQLRTWPNGIEQRWRDDSNHRQPGANTWNHSLPAVCGDCLFRLNQ